MLKRNPSRRHIGLARVNGACVLTVSRVLARYNVGFLYSYANI